MTIINPIDSILMKITINIGLLIYIPCINFMIQETLNQKHSSQEFYLVKSLSVFVPALNAISVRTKTLRDIFKRSIIYTECTRIKIY